MPHADLKYSNDLQIDAPTILAAIEAMIHAHDSDAGDCKGRAYPTSEFNHSHLMVEILMYRRSHRDAAFLDALSLDLETMIKSHLNQACFFSLSISFLPPTYIPNRFEP